MAGVENDEVGVLDPDRLAVTRLGGKSRAIRSAS